jgi:hypothetical protein
MQTSTEKPAEVIPEPTCPDCGALLKYRVKAKPQPNKFGVWMRCDGAGCEFVLHIDAIGPDGWKKDWPAYCAILKEAKEEGLKERAAKEASEKAREDFIHGS